MGLCFATTAGASVDFRWEDLRLLIVNAAFHLTGMVVPARANAEPVDPFEPSFYGFQKKDYFLRRGLRASDFRLGSSPKVILSETEIRRLERQRAHPGRLPLPERSERIVLLGNGLAERMIAYGFFETELQLRFPDRRLVIRNMARPAWTPSFRPHPARRSQWAFPGAETLRPEFSIHSGAGHFPSPDEWLETLRADTILAFFGFNESFDGPEGLEKYRAELEAFVRHTLAQKYNGESAPGWRSFRPSPSKTCPRNSICPTAIEKTPISPSTAASRRKWPPTMGFPLRIFSHSQLNGSARQRRGLPSTAPI